MGKKKQVFACLKGEHVKVEGCPMDQQTIGGIVYDGGICKFCFAVYYSPIGEAGLILVPKGSH